MGRSDWRGGGNGWRVEVEEMVVCFFSFEIMIECHLY